MPASTPSPWQSRFVFPFHSLWDHKLISYEQPVTSWRLYGQSTFVADTEENKVSHPIASDSVYTERYMDTPQNNPGGYVNASISNVEGFKNVDFLLAHGSGDDNGRCHRARGCLFCVLIVPGIDSAFCQLGAFTGHVHGSADTPLPLPDVHGQVRGSNRRV
jgi:hypothetical protein